MNGHIKKILFFMSFIFLYFLFPNSIVNATELPQSIAYKYHALGINAYNPCSSTTSDTSASCISPTGDQITWIGDSYSVGAKDIIESTFPGVDLGPIDSHPYIHCSKHIGIMGDSDTNPETCSSAGLSGVDLAKKIKDAGKMRPYLVFALATNDVDDPSSHLAELMNIIGDGTQVILTTARTEDGSDYTKTNEAIRKVAEEHTNVVVADWANSSEYKAEFFADDNTHPFSNGGMETWVNVIKSALPQNCNSAGLLSGDTVEEQVWNYLVSANIPNVSNRPEVIAGILGNINAESGFNPFAMGPQYGGYYYYGLFQDYGGNNNNALRDEINAAVGADYWSTDDTTSAPQDAINKALKITLDHLVNDDAEFKDFISKIDRPTKKTGAEGAESYAELFLVTYERAVNGSSPINDNGVCQVVQEMYGGTYSCNYQGTNVRREFAKEFYEKFASSTTTSTTTSSSVNTSSSSTPLPSTGDDCSKLAELRQELWNNASEKDRSDFMKTVCEENCSIAGVEGYMNQVIAYGSKHGTSINGGDGTLAKWLDVQCEAFRPATSSCRGEHTISPEEQSWIDEALTGTNHIRYAVGNATGGSDVGAGKIVCVWDGEKCRDDVDYAKNDGKGPCSDYSSSADFECWGMEMAEGWNEKLGITNCGSSGSGAVITNSSNTCAVKNGGSCTETVSEDAFPNYYQGDPQWSGVELSGGCTLGPCGCGATSYAEIVTALSGQKVTPVDVAHMTDSHPYWQTGGQGMVELDKMVGEKYGLEVEGVDYGNMSDFTSKAKKHLNEGWMIHLSGNVGDWGGLSSGAGHYVSLLKADGDKVLITSFNNIHGVSYYGKNSWITFEELEHLGVYPNSTFSITRKKGSSGSNCDIGANGLSAEQAAKLLAWYSVNRNDDTRQTITESYWDRDACRRNQCTAFSAFFVTKFTKQTLTGGTFSGSDAVDHAMAESGGGETSSEPSVFSLFQAPGHTGIVVGKETDGTFIYANNNGLNCSPLIPDSNAITNFNPEEYYAWNYGGWSSTPHIGIVSHDTGVGGSATYMKLDVDTKKLMDYINNGP